MNTVIAAGIGFVAVLVSVWNQQRMEAKRQRQATEDRRTEAATDRVRQAAAACDRLFVELGKSVPVLRANRRGRMEDETEQALTDRERVVEDEIETFLVDLPTLVQDRVVAGLDFIRNSDRIGSDDPRGLVHHYARAATIARNTALEMHILLTAFLRNEALPEPSVHFLEYEEAFRSYTEEMEDDFAEDIDQERTNRVNWLNTRPDLKSRLDARESRP